jgi:hypothetical protein
MSPNFEVRRRSLQLGDKSFYNQRLLVKLRPKASLEAAERRVVIRSPFGQAVVTIGFRLLLSAVGRVGTDKGRVNVA